MGLAWKESGAVWLVDFNVHGRIFRYANRRVTVSTNAGDALVYESGLGEDLSLSALQIFGRNSTDLSIHTNEDWPRIVARGAQIERQPVTVRLWYPGQTLEQASSYLDGESDGVKIGDQGARLSLSVVDDADTKARQLPPAQAQANDETWPVNAGFTLATGAIGLPIPVLIGYPGDHPKTGASVDIAQAAFRLPYVERQDPYTDGTGDKYAVAFGRIDAAQIQLYDYEGTLNPTPDATTEIADNLGQTITTIQNGLLNMPEDGEVWGGLRNASSWGGGLLSPYSGGVLRGAGEVIRYVLEYFTNHRVDRARMAANADASMRQT